MAEEKTKADGLPEDFDRFSASFEPKEEPPAERKFAASGFEKWMNVLLCRGDLAAESFEAPPVSFAQLFKYGSRKDKLLVYSGIALGVGAGVGQPLSQYLGGRMAEVLINADDKEALWNDGYLLVLWNLIIGIATVSITFLQYYSLRLACQNITATLRSRFIRSILRQEAAFFDTRKSGEINDQLNKWAYSLLSSLACNLLFSGINQIRDGIGDKIGLLTRGLSMFVSTTVMSFWINWRMTLMMVASAPVCCLTMSAMGRLVAGASKKQMKSTQRETSILHETIMNCKTIQSCNGQAESVAKLKHELDTNRIHGVLQYFTFSFTRVSYFGGMQFFAGNMTAGDVFIIANAITGKKKGNGRAYFIGVMSPHLMSILKARVAAALIYEQIERVPKIDVFSTVGVQLESPRGLVEFQDVHFSYPSRPNRPVLRGISWQAESGETVALVGHSGCGKSSSIALLCRLYEATGGRVCIDGVDVKSIQIRSLRSVIGVVSQMPEIFHGTIYENIALGDTSVTQKQVEAACRCAHATFIEKLENGYQTMLGSGGGIQLSGGQKQRIAIARAILHAPPILLLDEATSALDADSEMKVQEALKEASKGRTTIVIAHRLSTLRDVDKIVVIDEGRVVESGSHAELLKKEGVYASLVAAQQFQQTDEKPEDEEKKAEVEIPLRDPSLQSSIARSSVRAPTVKAGDYAAGAEDAQSVGLRNAIGSFGLIRLYTNCQGSYRKLAAGIVFSLLRGLELPLYILIMTLGFAAFQDKEVPFETFQNRLIWFLIVTLLVGVYSWCTIFGAVACLGWATEHISNRLKTRALANVLKQGQEFFDWPSTSNAKVLQRVVNNSTALKAALDTRLYHLVNNCFCSVIQVLLAAVACWEVCLSGMVLYSALFVLLGFLARLMKRGMREISDQDDSAKVAVEIIEQTRVIQLLGREEHFSRKYDDALRRFEGLETRMARADSVMFAITQSFIFFSDIFCYSVGIFLVYNGQRASSQVFVSAQATFCSPQSRSTKSSTQFPQSIPCSTSWKPPPAIDDHEQDGIEPEVEGDVHVERVVFAYPTRPHVNVANGLVLRARKAEQIALVGPSGQGKSTIINLMERCYEPKFGQITIDGSPIRRFRLSYLRSRMEPILFSCSIYDNIRLGCPGATQEDVFEAARFAHAAKFVERLPQGYQTEIGEKGAQLSGGQRQALDAESERAVQRALEVASSNRTCITIAHRLSSIQHADRIYYIENGRVVEAGTHAELMAQEGGKYAAMIAKQDLRS
ncbi:P glycoprotein 11 [Aphelenchoides fujianensis]|nr:P glycoprotein 11 [Aphelenchoides fujianensis]